MDLVHRNCSLPQDLAMRSACSLPPSRAMLPCARCQFKTRRHPLATCWANGNAVGRGHPAAASAASMIRRSSSAPLACARRRSRDAIEPTSSESPAPNASINANAHSSTSSATLRAGSAADDEAPSGQRSAPPPSPGGSSPPGPAPAPIKNVLHTFTHIEQECANSKAPSLADRQ